MSRKGACAYMLAIPHTDASNFRAKDVSFIKSAPSLQSIAESSTATFLRASPEAPASNLDGLSPGDELDAIDLAAP